MRDRRSSQPEFPVAGKGASGFSSRGIDSDQSAERSREMARERLAYKCSWQAGSLDRATPLRVGVLALTIVSGMTGVAAARAASVAPAASAPGQRQPLRDGWAIRSSQEV